jgi:hypothetical protein
MVSPSLFARSVMVCPELSLWGIRGAPVSERQQHDLSSAAPCCREEIEYLWKQLAIMTEASKLQESEFNKLKHSLSNRYLAELREQLATSEADIRGWLDVKRNMLKEIETLKAEAQKYREALIEIADTVTTEYERNLALKALEKGNASE